MVKKKKTIVIIAICAVVVCIAIVCMSIFAIGRKWEKSVRTQMDGFLTVTTDLHLEEEENSDSDDIGKSILSSILNDVEYEIEKINSESCTLKITSPDVYQLYSKVMEENPIEKFSSYDEYRNAVTSRLKKIDNEIKGGNYQLRTSTVEVAIKDGTIETTNEFADAIYGGLITLQEEMIERYIGEEEANE